MVGPPSPPAVVQRQFVHGGRDVGTVRSNSIIPEMLLAGLGTFPAAIHRFSVDLPMPSCLASSVPLMHLWPVIDPRFACMPFARQSPWSFGTPIQ